MTIIPIIATRLYSDEIHALIHRSDLAAYVEVVPSIQKWCSQHGVHEDNPFRVGKIVKNTANGRYLILLPDIITEDMRSSVTSAIALRGFSVEELSEPLNFLRHLVLHEIAHGLDANRSEQDCDLWAFEQLRALS